MEPLGKKAGREENLKPRETSSRTGGNKNGKDGFSGKKRLIKA